MPGYEVSRKLEKMGWHSSDTGELSFTDVEVPAENLLGEENRGFYLIMANFAWERLLMSLGAVGAMQRLLERRRSTTPASARRSAGRSAASRRSATRSPRSAIKAEVGPRAHLPRAARCIADERRASDGRVSRARCDAPGEAVHPARLRRGRRRVPSRSTAATATCASTGSSGRCATPASARSAAAPTRS